MTRLSGCLPLLVLTVGLTLGADDPIEAPPPRPKSPAAVTPPGPPRMPLTGLTAARPMFDACVYHYPVSTTSRECQAFVDQGLGMYYSYVWMEAARAFETALTFDPDCAYAWLMLHRSLTPDHYGKSGPPVSASPFQALAGGPIYGKLPDRVGRNSSEFALEMARKLMPRANHREQLLIQARLQEQGIWPGTPPDQRAKKAAQTLDELLTLYEDDEEGWFWRAMVAGGDGPNAKVPFYKSLLRLNPIHPGANHELVHFYEAIKRPALGWPNAEGYIKSSPGIPHAFHMQAHLAMRIGKWGPTTDWSWKAIELEKAYHKYQGVAPNEDFQFSHHLETLTRALVHDGRFAEAKQIKAEAIGYGYQYRPEWFRMAVAEKDWAGAEECVEHFRRRGKPEGAYYAAQMYLDRGETERAGAEVETLQQAQQARKGDRTMELRLWEVQGRHLCQTGNGEAGLKMLRKAVDATKNDYSHHSWGNGAVTMEVWGTAALECGNAAEAEEAFQEALAHDTGSVRGALGMWALCERLGRTEEAARYLKVAQRCWGRANAADFEKLKADVTARASRVNRTTATGGNQ
jgi:tetratricopeptide (TPR) repeat protein